MYKLFMHCVVCTAKYHSYICCWHWCHHFMPPLLLKKYFTFLSNRCRNQMVSRIEICSVFYLVDCDFTNEKCESQTSFYEYKLFHIYFTFYFRFVFIVNIVHNFMFCLCTLAATLSSSFILFFLKKRNEKKKIKNFRK